MKKIFFLFSIFFSGVSFGLGELKVGILPSIDLEPGGTSSIDLSYYVYNSERDQKIYVNTVFCEKGLALRFNPVNSILEISQDKDFVGFGKLELEISNSLNERASVSLLVRVQKKDLTTFKFKPKQPVNKVFIAGEFNGWNSSLNQLLDEDGDGTYQINLPIPPGLYQYKFVVDGRWIQDPENENKSPDGFGGFNSVINVKGHKPGIFVGISKKIQDKTLNFILKYTTETDSPEVDPDSIIVKVNNKFLGKQYLKWDERKKELKVTIPNLEEGCYQISVNALTKERKLIPEFYFFEKVDKKSSNFFNWRDAVIYFAFTDRFFNGKTSNDNPVDDPELEKSANYLGGDFAGITEKIKDGYFKKLGISAIWISPVIDNPDCAYRDALPPHKKFTGYHGYWPVSFDKVEEHFGTIEELKELVRTAHENNIKVIFDMVLNHVHEDNSIYKKYPNWFSKLLLPDGRKNIRLFDERPLDTWFDEFLPDFDYENSPEAVDFMVDNCLWWIKETNCDGFRLDAVKHMPHVFWKKLRLKIKQEIELPLEKNFYLVGETISSRDKIMEYVSPEELDGQFDFPLYWAIRDVFGYGTAGFERLESERKKSLEAYSKPFAIMSCLLGNHDFARFTAFADGDIKPGMNEKTLAWSNQPEVDNPETYKKLQLAFLFLLSQPGPPMIYYGDEIGLTGAGDPDNRRMMKFENLTKQEKETLDFVSKIVNLRNNKPALRYGTHKTLYLTKDVYVYVKQYFDDFVIIGMNLSDKTQKIFVELPEYLFIKSSLKDYFSGEKVKLNKNKIKMEIKPLSSVIIM